MKLDRSKWEPCPCCKPGCHNCLYSNGWSSYGKPDYCSDCEKYSKHIPDDNFCEECGRPLSDEALQKLKEKLAACNMDLTKWEPCECCRPKCNGCEYLFAYSVPAAHEACGKCVDFSNFVPENKFCFDCGRPLTEDALLILKRRLKIEV